MTAAYYERAGLVIYHADCREVAWLGCLAHV